jgi:formylglycine-generating enzyme
MPEAPKSFTQSLPDGTSFEMIKIKAGSFFIGNTDHEIHLPTYYMGKYPVTQALWMAVMGGENPAYFKGANRPVENVSWYDSAAFCNILNGLCGYPARYFVDKKYQQVLTLEAAQKVSYPDKIPVFVDSQHHGYSLPSEAAWEYAAIGAQKRAKYTYAGSNNLDEVGWYKSNSQGQTQPVGQKMANVLGLHDMSGNVWEWCEVWGTDKEQEMPTDDNAFFADLEGVDRVFCGGDWSSDAQLCRPSSRIRHYPADRNDFVGLRVAFRPLPGSWPARTGVRVQV